MVTRYARRLSLAKVPRRERSTSVGLAGPRTLRRGCRCVARHQLHHTDGLARIELQDETAAKLGSWGKAQHDRGPELHKPLPAGCNGRSQKATP